MDTVFKLVLLFLILTPPTLCLSVYLRKRM